MFSISSRLTGHHQILLKRSFITSLSVRACFRAMSGSVPLVAPSDPSMREGSEEGSEDLRSLAWRPSEMVKALDNYIIGQAEAKKRVAIALRNRLRRQRVPKEIKDEIFPKNILMVGTTGVGKTEIARRLAKISNLPFLRVESTQFTEVGFVGRDVVSIINDLVKVSAAQCDKEYLESEQAEARAFADKKIMEAIHMNKFRKEDEQNLKEGLLDSMVFHFEVPTKSDRNFDSSTPFFDFRPRECTVAEARDAWKQYYLESRIKKKDLNARAISRAEEGIVFIDEIDKICSTSSSRMGSKYDCSGEGVQRDLLPLIEGTTVFVEKFGHVRTDNILFIAAGSFSQCKPSDLLPELQGRLPVRVNLQPLNEHELFRILTEPKNNLLRQQEALLKTDNAEIIFQVDAIQEMSRCASELNRSLQNLGARRLHAVVEQVMEEISLEVGDSAHDNNSLHVKTITKEYVQQRLESMMSKSIDVKRFII